MTEKEISDLIIKLPNKYTYGDDEIPIQSCRVELTPIFTALANQSFDESIFPGRHK